jgi:trk system potassium uptake protein TrkA
VVTIKRYADSEKEETKCHVIGVPDPETVISENDNLLLFGKVKNIEKFIEINE